MWADQRSRTPSWASRMWRERRVADGFDYRPVAAQDSDAVKISFGVPIDWTGVRNQPRSTLKSQMHPRGPQGTVLLVEDSAPTRELLATVLRRGGYEVVQAHDGDEGMHQFGAHRPDIVVLDVHLPGLNGWEVLARIRERSEVPVLMLTALSDETSKVRGLNGGADDYLVKPTGAAELIARVGALLRRSRRVPGLDPGNVYDDGLVHLDFDCRRVTVDSREIQLTPLEYRLLSAFVRHPGVVLSREDLLREVWHDETGGPSDHVKIYVGYLRRKLSEAVDEDMIETVRGFGYRWLRAPGDGAGAGESTAYQGTWRTAAN